LSGFAEWQEIVARSWRRNGAAGDYARAALATAAMHSSQITVRPVDSASDRKAFVDFAWQVYRADPAWVPPLKDEVHALLDPRKNPWFGHARARLWLAERGGRTVGRISAGGRAGA
jgi:hypothetical protein